jgi:hypothetical protein
VTIREILCTKGRLFTFFRNNEKKRLLFLHSVPFIASLLVDKRRIPKSRKRVGKLKNKIMKKLKKNWSLLLVLMIVAAGHLISMRVLAEGDDPARKTDGIGLPEGLLVGYQPSSERVATGSRIEHMGFVGGSFSFVVNTYENISCCKKTDRAMDGCSGLPKCSDL